MVDTFFQHLSAPYLLGALTEDCHCSIWAEVERNTEDCEAGAGPLIPFERCYVAERDFFRSLAMTRMVFISCSTRRLAAAVDVMERHVRVQFNPTPTWTVQAVLCPSHYYFPRNPYRSRQFPGRRFLGPALSSGLCGKHGAISVLQDCRFTRRTTIARLGIREAFWVRHSRVGNHRASSVLMSC